MNKKTNTPNLSAASNDDWDYSGFDWNNVLPQASDTNSNQQSEPAKINPIPAVTTGGSTDEYRQASRNAPTADHYTQQMLDILDSATGMDNVTQGNNQKVPANLNDNGTLDGIAVPPSRLNQNNNSNQNVPSTKVEENTNQNVSTSPNVSTPSDNRQSTGQQDRTLDQVAFDFIKQMDLIRLPENVNFTELTPEYVKSYKQETELIKRQEALDYLRNNISHDPYMTELFDYAYYGGDYADMPRMRQLLDTEIDYKSLDLSDTDIQKEIVGMFLSEGLNPDNVQHARLISSIPNQVKSYETQMQLKDEAELARNHFVQKAQEQQYQEKVRVQRAIEESERQKLYHEEADRQWNRQFRQVIADSPWSQERKNAVVKEAREIITLDNGVQMPVWQYKQQMIMNSPELFHVFLDFTSKLNLNDGRFNDYGVNQQSTETVAQILQRIANKQIGNSGEGTGGATTLNNPNKQFTPPPINAGDDNWFF